MNFSLFELKNVLSNVKITHDVQCVDICTDSRQVKNGNLFVALRGENFDAHQFLNEVATQGASAVLVDHLPDGFELPAIKVPDTKKALAEIAQYWRGKFSIPVIAVTGSNGKTTVKEMIASILSVTFQENKIVATKGNLNNEIGVPLTIFRLNNQHQAAVIELGMNHQGEIALLTSITQPTVALVNNAQREHQEFMQSVKAVAIENGAVIKGLQDDGVAVFPVDDEFSNLWREFAIENKSRKICTFGISDHADVKGSFIPQQFGCDLIIEINGKSISMHLHAAGKHNVLNALAAAACCHSIGISLEKIAEGLSTFLPVNGRLQLKQSLKGAKIIDDTYNANPDSVIAAIDVLSGFDGDRILILGDMGEVGENGAQFHSEIGQYAKNKGIKHLYTLGKLAKFSSDVFGDGSKHFEVLEDLIKSLMPLNTEHKTMLIKGSRFMKMERVVQYFVTPIKNN
jgi:UDP-N-acetylmuramoyl-tripeptide--D-alanyl-D-alanine ligase